MKTNRTQEEINRQIEGLKEQRKTLPEYSGFGDPNWKAIDAMIDILSGKKTMFDFDDDIDEDDDFRDEDEKSEDSYVNDEAQQAEYWLEGQRKEDLFE